MSVTERIVGKVKSRANIKTGVVDTILMLVVKEIIDLLFSKCNRLNPDILKKPNFIERFFLNRYIKQVTNKYNVGYYSNNVYEAFLEIGVEDNQNLIQQAKSEFHVS